jgi:hypothetical protein
MYAALMFIFVEKLISFFNLIQRRKSINEKNIQTTPDRAEHEHYYSHGSRSGYVPVTWIKFFLPSSNSASPINISPLYFIKDI